MQSHQSARTGLVKSAQQPQKSTRRSTKRWLPFDDYSPNAAIFFQNKTMYMGPLSINSQLNSKIAFSNSFCHRGTNGVKSMEAECNRFWPLSRCAEDGGMSPCQTLSSGPQCT